MDISTAKMCAWMELFGWHLDSHRASERRVAKNLGSRGTPILVPAFEWQRNSAIDVTS